MKRKNSVKTKVIFIIIGICLIVILSILAGIYAAKKSVHNEVSISIQQDVKNIIDNLGSKFISQVESEEETFDYDIYLKFKKPLYTDGKSNERLYTNLISQVVSNLKTSFRLIDESQNLIIRVTYNKDENRYYYTVNGEDDYFKKHDSINSYKNHSKVKNSDFSVQSDIINELIDTNWKINSEIFGTKESSYNNYDIYFDEGIEVKVVSGKIYNVVFTSKYEDKVVNGLKVGDRAEKIKSAIGDPTFSRDEIIGYRNEDIYVFFSKDQISVYRNEEYDYTEFIEILEDYVESKINVKEFTNKLTYLWSDYSSYTYDSTYVNLVYANQGIEIYLKSDDPMGITIYGNCSAIDDFDEFIVQNKINAKLEDDLIFLDEENRIELNNAGVRHDLSNPEYIGKSKNFVEHISNNLVEFYSMNSDYPSFSIVETIQSYFWFNDNIFVYSIQGKGIYYYNVIDKSKTELITGSENYKFNDYKNGILNYDNNKELELGSD